MYKNKIRWLLIPLIVILFSSSYAQGIRKEYREMTVSERDALMTAYFTQGGPAGVTGLNNTLATFHASSFAAIHFNPIETDVFLAWHRQASQELERQMKDDASNEWITLGYWDWTTANTKADPLWSAAWLGQFNTPWSLGRLATAPPAIPLPTQAAIDAALLVTNFFTFSRPTLEDAPLHTAAHGWVGGTMSSGNSPKDPAFFFHHNMVDKIWADWYELNHNPATNYYVLTTMPRYTTTDPESIVDPRSLGIFYAEAELAVLDKYTVANTFTSSEKFGYQYTIEAKDNFLIPNGNDAEFRSCNEVVLKSGFLAERGSNFLARLDYDCDFGTPKVMDDDSDFAVVKGDSENNLVTGTGTEVTLKSYPNPFDGQSTIEYTLNQTAEISIEILNSSGRHLQTLMDNQLQEEGTYYVQFDAGDLPNGLYYCALTSKHGKQTVKMMLNK